MENTSNMKRVRRDFGHIEEVARMPNLIEVQKDSYENFLQMTTAPDKRRNIGIQSVLMSSFPITDFGSNAELQFVSYEFDRPKYDVEECLRRGLTYSASMRAVLRLIIWDIDDAAGTRSIRDIKEQDVFMGDIPLMTDKATFIINGIERVIISQMQRSPGVFFDHDQGKTHVSGKLLFSARIIPYRGSWVDFEFDAKDVLYVRIDKKRKIPATSLLYALPSAASSKELEKAASKGKTFKDVRVEGMTPEEILSYFYNDEVYTKDKKGFKTAFNPENMRGALTLKYDLVNAKNDRVAVPAGSKLSVAKARKLASEGLSEIRVASAELVGKYLSSDLVNEATGEVIASAGDEITAEIMEAVEAGNIKEVSTLFIDNVNIGAHIRNTLALDKNKSREEALIDIYRVMRPGEPPAYEAAENLFYNLFFDSARYDLSAVGRVKMNSRLGKDAPVDADDPKVRVLNREDILETVKILTEIKDGRGSVDDIDSLANRRVRSVGELMENQLRIGLLKMERTIREKMSGSDIDTVMPHDLINAKPIVSTIREFFAGSTLSQFMDQNNPLSEITHKRRVSALGPGGLSRDRAGFEVRDVHHTHYGRICPIETPEGPNIGLINSLSSYAIVDKYGFIETPYRRVVKGKVTEEVVYLSAFEESKYIIAQSNAEINDKNEFTQEYISCRKDGNFVFVAPDEIDFIDVSPKQIISVAAALIPFLENDDSNRALMGSNMQRQGVPLLRSEAPFVGTGIEAKVARDSKACITANCNGVVQQVDATRIVIRATDNSSSSPTGVEIYNLSKFERSNQSTCINQKPLVNVGDKVEKGDIIADGPCTDKGELALGRNVLVAFMTWKGYNYEDSIIISERIVRDDVFTSIHIEEFEVMARDTKLGPEEITRDIPNVGEEALSHLDEVGIVHIGAEVKPGDILVGKVTPKGESPITPEEKLLLAIFGEKAANVRDSSLRVPPGTEGTVVDVRIFSRRGVEKDERAMAIEMAEIEKLTKDRDDERSILEKGFAARLKDLLHGGKLVEGPKDFAKKGTILTGELLDTLTPSHLKKIVVEKDSVMKQVEEMRKALDTAIKALNERFEEKVEKLQRGDEMLPGVLKSVKVFIAVKRKLQPGDKMAGRHGNKGVISKIVPAEDMPYMENGEPVDILLTPLGIPSRMNVGQILETHLGWACKELGKQVGDMLNKVYSGEVKAPELKDKLAIAYGSEYKDEIMSLKDNQVKGLAHQIKDGMFVATPVFDGAREEDINNLLAEAGLPTTGQIYLYDGGTGERFDRKITVGYIYMLKLHHLVDEKIHARSVGPYSLVTQQPLGGKAQFGGQRFGEMEVWALEAYGAAYTLQEMLTIKSDDVAGRTKVYESIVRGQNEFSSGTPESFNVLMKEIKSLGLDMELVEEAN